MTAGADMTSKPVECDLYILMGKLEENLEEISSVALLSPACFILFSYLLDMMCHDVIVLHLKRNEWLETQSLLKTQLYLGKAFLSY